MPDDAVVTAVVAESKDARRTAEGPLATERDV
jgi:hypothetical protein